MDKLLTEWIANSTLPGITAMLLGFLISLSPCPLATNITAMGFIGKDMADRRKVFLNGLAYTLGTIVSYSLLAGIIYLGADMLELSFVFQRYAIKIIGPLMIVIGLAMFDVIRIPFPGFNRLIQRFGQSEKKTPWHAYLLGMFLALAFCPNTGALYFGMLIPLSIGSPYGMLLPIIFAISSAIPVVIFAYLIAFSLNGVGILFGKIKVIELWIRRIVAAIFIIAGTFLVSQVYF